MDEDELSTQSFVVRIWAEKINHGPPGWRGHIIHVRGNEDRYFDELDSIADFIRPFLSKMGVRVNALPLLARWGRYLRRALSSRTRE